jgi:hypothetical protein
MNVILKFANAKRVVTWHGVFGAATAKPLQIWSNNAENEARETSGDLGSFMLKWWG